MRSPRLNVIGLAVTILLVFFVSGCRKSLPAVDSQVFTKALWNYATDLRKRHEPVPASVTLDDLVRLGYMKPEEAGAFGGVKAVFYADADEAHPQRVLVEATMADGTVLALLGDGSVQQFSRESFEAYKKQHAQPVAPTTPPQAGPPGTNATPPAGGPSH